MVPFPFVTNSGGATRCQHASTEGHSEDCHPDARGLPPAHTTGPGEARTHTHTHNQKMTHVVLFKPQLYVMLAASFSLQRHQSLKTPVAAQLVECVGIAGDVIDWSIDRDQSAF